MPNSEREKDNVVRLGEARNPQEASLWRQVLEESGIECRVVGDILEAGLGDLPKIGPEVLVHEADLDKAREILARYQQSASNADDEES